MGLPNGSATQTPDILLTQFKPWHSFITDHPVGFWFIFWGEFAERWPKLGQALGVRLAVNRKYVAMDYVLLEGDEVAVIPPVSGG